MCAVVNQLPNLDPRLVLVFSFRGEKSSDAEEPFFGPADRAGLGPRFGGWVNPSEHPIIAGLRDHVARDLQEAERHAGEPAAELATCGVLLGVGHLRGKKRGHRKGEQQQG
jgi:hypothetical protein